VSELSRFGVSIEKTLTYNIMGTVTIINNHHIRNLAEHLTYIEHSFQRDTPFSGHVHISHDLCLEVIVVKTNEKKLREFTNVIGGREHDRGHGH
jgi:CopG family transcriptional regulator, nickel-responsive regulator